MDADKTVIVTYKATGSTHTHSYGTEWKYDDTNHWHECDCGDKADTAAHSFQWVIDKAATKEATGIKHEECTVCGAKRSENTEIPALRITPLPSPVVRQPLPQAHPSPAPWRALRSPLRPGS